MYQKDLQTCRRTKKEENNKSHHNWTLSPRLPPPRPFLISFLLSSWRAVRSYRPHLEERDPIWAMTGRTAPSSDGLLAEIFLGQEICAQPPGDHFIITLIISDRHDWRDTRGKWSRARNPDRSWWHCHTSLKLFGRSPWLHGQHDFFPSFSLPHVLCNPTDLIWRKGTHLRQWLVVQPLHQTVS